LSEHDLYDVDDVQDQYTNILFIIIIIHILFRKRCRYSAYAESCSHYYWL